MAAGGKYTLTVGVVDEATAKLKEINSKLNEAAKPQRGYQREVDRNNKLMTEQRRQWQNTANSWADQRGIKRIGATMGETEKATKGATSAIFNMRSALGALVAGGTVAAIGKMAKDFANMGTNLKIASAQTGVSGAVINATRGIGSLNGLKPEAMQSSLSGLGQAMQQAILDPSSMAAQSFAARGISTAGVKQWQAGTPDEQMANVADVMKKMKEEGKSGPSQVQQLQSWGIDPSLLPMLQRGGDAYKKDLAKSEQINPFTPEMAENADKLSRAFGESELHWTHLRNELVDHLTPGIIGAVAGLGNFADWLASKVPAIIDPLLKDRTLTKADIEKNPAMAGNLTPEQQESLPEGEKKKDWFQDFKEKYVPWGNKTIGSGLFGGGTAPNGVPKAGPTFGAPSGAPGAPSGAPVADTTMTPAKTAFLDTLSGPESRGRYDIKNGGERFTDMSKFPEGVGAGGTSTASGRYQFTSGTWKEAAEANNLKDFSAPSQDKAAWWLAQREYKNKTGRQLEDDVKSGGHEADIAGALKGRWPSLPGGSQTHQSQDTFNSNLSRNLATANAAVPVAAAPAVVAAGPEVPINQPAQTATATPAASTLDVTISGNVPGATIGANAKGPAFGGPVRVDQTMPRAA